MAPSTCVLLFAEAFAWLCLSRRKFPESSDIWDFRRIWPQQASEIMRVFWQGAYQLGLQQKITLASGETVDLWSACDALVLKVITWLIEARVRPFMLTTCYHLKGHGGLKGAVRAALDASPAYPFVCKTDVKSYYDSINHIRYMDDILIFAPTRWKLRHAIRVLNQTFAELGLEQHPNKTVIGRTARGFDFLGYHVAPERVTLAAHTIRRMNQKALRLYEQEPQDAQARVQRLGVYLMRWRRWTRAGLRRRGGDVRIPDTTGRVPRRMASVPLAGRMPRRVRDGRLRGGHRTPAMSGAGRRSCISCHRLLAHNPHALALHAV
jgi:hypothetical protein